jgi:hypothetical protein
MGYDIFDALVFDWRLTLKSRDAERARQSWATDPVLGALTSLDEIVDRTGQGSDRTDANHILAALARRAPRDDLASRALLQAVLPGLGRLAKRHRASLDNDIAAEVILLAYQRIRCYPFDQRPRSVAANIVLDVHQALWRTQRRVTPATCRLDEQWVSHVATLAAEPEPGSEVREIITAAVAAKRLSRNDGALLLRTNVGDPDMVALAAEQGLSLHALWKRRQRAERRLVAACDELALA